MLFANYFDTSVTFLIIVAALVYPSISHTPFKIYLLSFILPGHGPGQLALGGPA